MDFRGGPATKSFACLRKCGTFSFSLLNVCSSAPSFNSARVRCLACFFYRLHVVSDSRIEIAFAGIESTTGLA